MSGPGVGTRSDVGREARVDYGEDRMAYPDDTTARREPTRDARAGYVEDRRAYPDDTVAHREPTQFEPVRGDRDGRMDSGRISTRKVRETKPAFLTTEFWFALGGIAALIAVYVIKDDPSLDLFRTALLATLIGVAYIVSRGLAKAGSRTTRQPEDPRIAVGHDLR